MIRPGRILASASLLLAAACADAPTGAPTAAAPDAALAPLLSTSIQDESVVPGQYLVVFRRGTADPRGVAAGLAKAHGLRLRGHFDSPRIQGFSVAGVNPAALEALRRNPNVEYVEPNKRGGLAGVQTSPWWGLDRIDHYSKTLDSKYYYNNTATSVKAYIIDTGIRYDHTEFGGRAIFGYDAYGSTGSDCQKHGTHVAGVVGGSGTGVAKGVTLVSVRAGDCYDTYLDGLVLGTQFVTANHAAGVPAVANMSSRIPYGSATLDAAVQEAIDDGVVFVVAAGNDAQGGAGNACLHSPARLPAAITVGATDATDARAAFSNFGTCVDLFAPGVDIRMPDKDFTTDYARDHGTSFAAPHVAGVAALYLHNHPQATPQQVRDTIVFKATAGVTNLGTGSPDKLLQSVLMSMRIEGPATIPCGQSATYRIVPVDAIDPYTDYRWYAAPNLNYIVATGEYRTITAGTTTSQVGLIASYRDARNSFIWNGHAARWITLCP